MSKVIEITDEEFDEEVLQSDTPTEVDFWAPWCQPCLRVSPIYDRLSREYGEKFKFCKINVEIDQLTAIKYQVMSIPMQMFFVDGQKVDEILGAVPEHVIRTTVENTLRRFPADPKDRFKTLLKSWTEHNKVQREKLRKWAEKNGSAESEPIYHRALQAVRELEIANDHLVRTLMEFEEVR